MPNIADALDLQRFDELRRDAEMALNLWDAFRLAVKRGDGEIVRITRSRSRSSPDQPSLL